MRSRNRPVGYVKAVFPLPGNETRDWISVLIRPATGMEIKNSAVGGEAEWLHGFFTS